MELNNSHNSMVTNTNFKRMNRLQIQEEEPSMYDNDGFVNDDSNVSTTYTADSFPDQTVADELMTIRVHQLTFPQNDISNTGKDHPTKPRRQLPITKNNTLVSTNSDESFELQNLSKRNSVGSINISSNPKTGMRNDKDAMSLRADVDKLVNNKSVIQAISHMERKSANKNNSESENRFKQSRQAFSADQHDDDDDVFDGPSRLRRVGSLGWEKLRRRPLQLLRDLSFSDANDSTMMDYGSLKNINLPKRSEKGPISPETTNILESLMQELTKRGKISQVAVLDLDQSCVLASVPAGFLCYSDVIGMTKAMIGLPSLFRLQIANTDYHCFKHREDAIQGRAPDVVMVMQMAETCLVAGFAREDAPGSCNSEVHEMTKVLIDAGW